MSEQEKKWQEIYDLSTVYKAKKNFLQKKLLKEKVGWRIEQKTTKRSLIALATTKDPTKSIRKHINEKIVRTAIKQDLNPDLYSFDYAIWGVLENKTNSTSHPNIGSLKTAIEEE